MCPERISEDELRQIVQELDGADDIIEYRVCNEHGIDRDTVNELMTSRGYEWEDKWVKEPPRLP